MNATDESRDFNPYQAGVADDNVAKLHDWEVASVTLKRMAKWQRVCAIALTLVSILVVGYEVLMVVLTMNSGMRFTFFSLIVMLPVSLCFLIPTFFSWKASLSSARQARLENVTGDLNQFLREQTACWRAIGLVFATMVALIVLLVVPLLFVGLKF